MLRLLTTLWASAKDEKIIHVVGLHEVVLIDEHEPGAPSLFDDHLFVESVIVAFAIAIDDAEQSASAHCLTSSFEQANRLRNFVVGFQQQHRIDAFRRQQRIIFLSKNRAYVCAA